MVLVPMGACGKPFDVEIDRFASGGNDFTSSIEERDRV